MNSYNNILMSAISTGDLEKVALTEEVEKKILKRGKKWVVTDSTGKKVLGTHTSRASALRQLQAVEAAKHRRAMRR